MTTTKVFPQMRGVNSRLAELKAVTSELSLAEKRALLESLSEDVQAFNDAKCPRIEAPYRR